MILNIYPVIDKHYTCLENVYATFLKSIGKECDLLFAGSWSFYLEETEDILGTRLSSDRNGAWRNILQDEFMEQYYGIKVNWHDIEHFHELTSIVNFNLDSDLLTCICLDSFWCPWVPSYQIYDTPHYFLIAGRDESNRNYLCVDPQYPDKIHELSIYNFEKGFYEEERLKQEYGEALVDGFGECASFTTVNVNVQNVNCVKILESALSAVIVGCHGKSDFYYMRAYANELGRMESIKSELPRLSEVDPHHSWIFRRMEHISWGRLNFAKMLKKLHEQKPIKDILNLAQQFEEANKKWDNINLLLLKACYKSDESQLLKKIANIINHIADYEEQIAKEMESVIQKMKGVH